MSAGLEMVEEVQSAMQSTKDREAALLFQTYERFPVLFERGEEIGRASCRERV